MHKRRCNIKKTKYVLHIIRHWLIGNRPPPKSETQYLQTPSSQHPDQMLKFTAGAILGWAAARTLDNKPMAPPTLEELLLLTHKGVAMYENTLKQIQNSDATPPQHK